MDSVEEDKLQRTACWLWTRCMVSMDCWGMERCSRWQWMVGKS